jgi:DNA-binding transcriptional LysR family regulator
VSQPAVTNALKRLETHFGSKLVDRVAPEFTLTKAGQLVYEECLEIYGGVSRMAQVLKNVRDDVSGHVSIETPTHAESPIIDAVMVRFHRAHPKATVSIKVVPSGDVVTSVKRKNASCGIGLVTSKSPNLEYQVIYRERFALYCGRNSTLYGRDDIALEEICAQPYVTFPTDAVGGELHNFAVARQKYGVTSSPAARSYHLEELRRLIEIGVGIGPHPVHVARRFVDQGRLWRLRAFDDLPVFEVCLIINPRTRLNQAERAFIHIFQEEIGKIPLADRSY